jgi:hypothetical protein
VDGAYNEHRREETCAQNFGLENLKGRDNLKVIGLDGKIIFKWFVKKYNVRVWTE